MEFSKITYETILFDFEDYIFEIEPEIEDQLMTETDIDIVYNTDNIQIDVDVQKHINRYIIVNMRLRSKFMFNEGASLDWHVYSESILFVVQQMHNYIRFIFRQKFIGTNAVDFGFAKMTDKEAYEGIKIAKSNFVDLEFREDGSYF